MDDKKFPPDMNRTAGFPPTLQTCQKGYTALLGCGHPGLVLQMNQPFQKAFSSYRKVRAHLEGI